MEEKEVVRNSCNQKVWTLCVSRTTSFLNALSRPSETPYLFDSDRAVQDSEACISLGPWTDEFQSEQTGLVTITDSNRFVVASFCHHKMKTSSFNLIRVVRAQRAQVGRTFDEDKWQRRERPIKLSSF